MKSIFGEAWTQRSQFSPKKVFVKKKVDFVPIFWYTLRLTLARFTH